MVIWGYYKWKGNWENNKNFVDYAKIENAKIDLTSGITGTMTLVRNLH